MQPQLYIVEPSTEAALAPLTDLQQENLCLPDFPPIRYADLSQLGYSGYCSYHPDMPQNAGGEISIDLSYARGRSVSESSRKRRLAQVYIHELAHRLTPRRHRHDAIFCAVMAALLLRAFDSEDEVHKAISWYDVQDEKSPGIAIDHAINFGREHEHSLIDARNLPALAETSWKKFLKNSQSASKLQSLENELAKERGRALFSQIDIERFKRGIKHQRSKFYLWMIASFSLSTLLSGIALGIILRH